MAVLGFHVLVTRLEKLLRKASASYQWQHRLSTRQHLAQTDYSKKASTNLDLLSTLVLLV